MENSLFIPLSHNSCRILQLTDTHLFEQKQSKLLGINTYESFVVVIDKIQQEGRHYDLILATGDLSQDKSTQSYHHFDTHIQRIVSPCVWLPGNHDQPEIMANTFNSLSLFASKSVLIGSNWLLLLLNSHVLGQAYGTLSIQQLLWLEEQLNLYPGRHVMLALHHPVDSVGCQWLDVHKLSNSNALKKIIQKYSQINLLVCGHIHQKIDRMWAGLRWLSTPSTCVQFKPNSDTFALDSAAQPAWREICLGCGGTISTTVHYLPGNHFRCDVTQQGY